MTHTPVLTLPGWQGSGPGHWQSRWEALHGCERVQQHDWQRPLRGDWIIQLEEALLKERDAGHGPAVLVAHSLGCWLVAAWASHSQHTALVKAALLVAPPDLTQDSLRSLLPSWSKTVPAPLPFATRLLASQNDPFCGLERSGQLAAAWGSSLVDMGAQGHLNAESSLGDWPEGWDQLAQLVQLVQVLPDQA